MSQDVPNAEFLQSTLPSVDQLPTNCDDDPLTWLVDQIQVATYDTDTRDECVIALEECIDEYLRTNPIITAPSLISAFDDDAITINATLPSATVADTLPPPSSAISADTPAASNYAVPIASTPQTSESQNTINHLTSQPCRVSSGAPSINTDVSRCAKKDVPNITTAPSSTWTSSDGDSVNTAPATIEISAPSQRQHSRSTKLAPVAVTTVESRHSMTSVVAEAPSQSVRAVRDIFLYISFQITKEDAKREAAGSVEHM